jgi:hypothetical protein
MSVGLRKSVVVEVEKPKDQWSLLPYATPIMEMIQANLDSGALPEVVYGRNEPPLILFHRSVNAALEEGMP